MSSSPERSATVLATLSTLSCPLPESPIRSTAREKSVSASSLRAHTSRSLRPESAELGKPWRRSWISRAPLTRSLTNRDSSAWRSSPQFLSREARHVDEEVHPIEQRPGDSALVAFDLANRAPADPPPVPCVAAGTWVHGTEQRDPRRIAERRCHPRDRHVPILQGLA